MSFPSGLCPCKSARTRSSWHERYGFGRTTFWPLSTRDRQKRCGPTENEAMPCRPGTPKAKRCAVGRKETMRCRFASRVAAPARRTQSSPSAGTCCSWPPCCRSAGGPSARSTSGVLRGLGNGAAVLPCVSHQRHSSTSSGVGSVLPCRPDSVRKRLTDWLIAAASLRCDRRRSQSNRGCKLVGAAERSTDTAWRPPASVRRPIVLVQSAHDDLDTHKRVRRLRVRSRLRAAAVALS